MKLTKPLFWLLTALWFAAGTWWYSCNHCSKCDTTTITAAATKDSTVIATVPALTATDTVKVVDTVIAKKILFEPKTVYFNTGQNTLHITPELASYLESAKKYLSNNSEKKLMITGYSDNVGNANKNVTLSNARAEFVKSELSKTGIPADQMFSSGKGMADPIADNKTADGRAKNRRVTITLQQ